MDLLEKYLGEATFTVSYPSEKGKGPGKTKNFQTLEKAKEEAKKASKTMNGWVDVMRNGILQTSYVRGEER